LSTACRQASTKREPVLEQLEERIVLYAFFAPTIMYNATVNVTLTSPNSVVAHLSPQIPNLFDATVQFGFPSIGAFAPNYKSPPNPQGFFQYTGGQQGVDNISYQVTQTSTGLMSNVGDLQITVNPPPKLLPSTPFYNSLRKRWSINPARFEFFHPKIGALFAMEAAGMPPEHTTIVSANKHFDVGAARLRHAENPRQFDQKQPVLGALFELENPASSRASLLPQTAHYSEQRAVYDNHPARYQAKHVYLGAIFAIENLEQYGTTTMAPSPAKAHQSTG
jgi:hypothetical protein